MLLLILKESINAKISASIMRQGLSISKWEKAWPAIKNKYQNTSRQRRRILLRWLDNSVCMIITCSKSIDQPGKVANHARGQLNRENEYFPVPFRALRIWSRETGSAVPSRVSLLISILRLNLVFCAVYLFI